MKKTTLLKTMLLLCALVVGSTCAWADNASVIIQTYASTNSWTTGTAYATVNINSDVTATGLTNGNNSKYYSTNYSWRHYEGDSGTITIATTNGVLNSVTFVYANGNNGIIKDGTTTVDSNTAYAGVNGKSSVTFSVGHSSGTKNGNVQITSITVTYTPASSSPLDHITLSGTYPTEFYVGDAFSHDGMTVTAHFEDTSTSDVTSSATFTGYNMSTSGDQTVTVSYTKGAVTKTATYDITVSPAPTAAVTLDFSSNDWGISVSPTKTVDATEFTSGGYTITLEGSANNGYYFDTNNIMLGKSGASLTLPAFGFNVSKIKVYGASGASASVTFNIFVGDDAVSTSATSSQVDHEFAIAAGKRNVGTIYVIKVTNANNMRISKIEVFGNGCEAGLVGAAGWATYVTTAPVTYVDGDAFAVTSVGESVGLTSVTSVPTGTPLLLKGAGQKTAILLDAEPADLATNLLAISDGTNGVGDYVLYNYSGTAGFYKWNGSALDSGKVYLPKESVASARDFISLDEETTVITDVRSQKSDVRGEYFNLAGQRVAQPTKGLYIVNGKKVIIK